MALYGMQLWQERTTESNYRYDSVGKNSEAISLNDPLTISSGVLSVGGTTNTIIGVAVKTATMSSTNQTVALVRPGFIPANLDTVFLMGTNSDLTGNATDGGTYYKLSTATTNAVQVDVTSGVQTGANRVVEIVRVDPRGIGGTGANSGLREVLVRVVKSPYYNISITA